MAQDALLVPRGGGSSPRVTATEAGSTSLTRDATTGQVVVAIDKLPIKGMTVVVANDADTGTSIDKSVVVTIEESDALGSGWATALTFPAVAHGASANVMKRASASQKKYLRSVCTLSGVNGTYSVEFKIYLEDVSPEED